MADPTNRSDPTYSNDPRYVWSGGRWQFAPNSQANPPPSGHVQGNSLGTPGGFGDVFTGLFDRLGGKPFSSSSGAVPLNASIPNSELWQSIARQNAGRTQASNPYNNGIADQARGQQLALIEQLRQQMLGPSLAGMQGQGALARSGQAALGAAAVGGPGANRGAMMNAQQVGAGLGGDVGQARLAEVMRAQAGMGGVAGGLRGGDLQSATLGSQFGLQAQGLADKNSMFYSQMGAGVQSAQDRMALENYKLIERLKMLGRQQNMKEAGNYMNTVATMAGGAV